MSVVTACRTGEDNHAAHALLETRRVVAEDEHRSRPTGAKQTHGGPDQYRATDLVTPGRKKDYAAAVLGCLIEGVLNRIRVVRLTITLSLYGDRSRIRRWRLQRRCRRERRCGQQRQRCEEGQHAFHPNPSSEVES